jgi:hydrogenase expression/formation protein
MDIESLARQMIREGKKPENIVPTLTNYIKTVKRVSDSYAEELAHAVIEEISYTIGIDDDILVYTPSGVSMGEFGVGSRGTGDFYAHRKIAEIIGDTNATVGVDQMDDAGVIQVDDRYVICTVDGMHSRLSEYPFLAGFHATRATLRDCLVMGAKPIMLFSDIHVADDGDTAKIFDYTAGITAVGELLGVPLVAGSTLRIGGDMVLGDRLVGCVGCVGIAEHLTARKNIKPGDVVLMTEGAGGGTIATTALYSGHPAVVERTLNLKFLTAAQKLLMSPVLATISSMTDVTNGGLRGDIHEMAETAQCHFTIYENAVRGLVDSHVMEMLDHLSIDYLGISLDALLIIAPPDAVPGIIEVVESVGVQISRIGEVQQEKGVGATLVDIEGNEQDFTPKFREAPYTPVKKVVDKQSRPFEEMKEGVHRAAQEAIAKKKRIMSYIQNNHD